MSTRPIREALERLAKHSASTACECDACGETRAEDMAAYTAALEAVRAIEEMAKRFSERRDMKTTDYDVLDDIAKEAP